MRVALWGSYDEGNFGDDIMGLAIAQTCREAGASVVAYRIAPSIADAYSVCRVESLQDLLGEADVCIIGGGEFLFRDSVAKRWTRGYAKRFEASCRELVEHLHRRSVRFAAISVGGDGGVEFGRLSPHRRALFGSPLLRYVSVRLRSDQDLFASVGRAVEYFPDLLLCMRAILPSPDRGPRSRVRIGINVHRATGLSLVRALQAALGASSEVDLVLIRSHLADSGHDYEVSSRDVDEVIAEHQYRDPYETALFLAGCDVVISSKLHVGVVAMAYGGRFISYCGKPKVRAFMATLPEAQVYAQDEVKTLVEAVCRLVRSADRRGSEAYEGALERMRAEALGHLEALRRLVTAPA